MEGGTRWTGTRGGSDNPNYTPTRDIEQVVHTLRAMFKPTSVEPELGQGL